MRPNLFAVFAAFAAICAAADLSGTWKRNPVKSQPISNFVTDVMKVEKAGASTYRFEWSQSSASGEKRQVRETRACDGGEHTSESGGRNTYSCSPDALKHTFKRDGKLTSELTLTVAADGKTHTAVRKLFDSDGRPTGRTETLVFERQ